MALIFSLQVGEGSPYAQGEEGLPCWDERLNILQYLQKLYKNILSTNIWQIKELHISHKESHRENIWLKWALPNGERPRPSIKHSPVERFSADTYPMVPLSLGGQGLAIPVITGFPSIFTIAGSPLLLFDTLKYFLCILKICQIEPHSLMCSYDAYKTFSNQCVSYSWLEFPGRLLFECASRSHKEGLNTHTNALTLWCRLSKFYQAVSSMLIVNHQ